MQVPPPGLAPPVAHGARRKRTGRSLQVIATMEIVLGPVLRFAPPMQDATTDVSAPPDRLSRMDAYRRRRSYLAITEDELLRRQAAGVVALARLRRHWLERDLARAAIEQRRREAALDIYAPPVVVPIRRVARY